MLKRLAFVLLIGFVYPLYVTLFLMYGTTWLLIAGIFWIVTNKNYFVDWFILPDPDYIKNKFKILISK